MSTPAEDRLVLRSDLAKSLNVTGETLRVWLKSGKLPKPDIALSQKTLGWRLSTLQAAGIGLL